MTEEEKVIAALSKTAIDTEDWEEIYACLHHEPEIQEAIGEDGHDVNWDEWEGLTIEQLHSIYAAVTTRLSDKKEIADPDREEKRWIADLEHIADELAECLVDLGVDPRPTVTEQDIDDALASTEEPTTHTSIVVPIDLIRKICDLGQQDIYTDAWEYEARVDNMQKAVIQLQALLTEQD